MPNREWDTNIWKADCSKFKADVGWLPTFTFEEGFQRTVRWFQEHPEYLAQYQKN